MTKLLALGLLTLTACTAPAPESTDPATSETATPAESTPAETDTAGEQPSAELGGTLRVISHDSFTLSDGMLDQFQQETGVKVERIEAGDAGEMLNRLILTKQAPLADVVYGLDNSMLPRAQAEDLLTPYRSPALDSVPEEYRLDEDGLLNTVDYGVVALNYDRAAWDETGLPLPGTLDQLNDPEYASNLVIPSPATSSPGLAFLLATVNELGEEGAWAWWNEAETNGMKIVGGWSDAYYTEFTRAGGAYPLVLSYGSSPAAEVFFAEGYDPAKIPSESPTANLFIPGTTALQLEGVGILKGSENEAAARAFVDWMLSEKVQADIPTNMWVYPAVEGTKLDPVFALAEETDVAPFEAELTEDPQALIDAWVENVQRK
ncbi:thiamine ABC transporter substrate-binding protein [Deinococcus radiophilus]|uniref:Thiamine ABC transporter substrate-binding protein n=2 Tax=Deinococcus radiophilus TaxID=32062 RepID=A0A431W675_9DEIO|nr:thiamine ABC transporter substrate-binding protein [Deinococcus radiophilus]RTR30957.1 thiamine ABC transporter substrate-binding protein [Deinococcus radiophilus]UFA51282.1 thiamine ABC transporter substrate-binding protein [Deinococcus radiophilus]